MTELLVPARFRGPDSSGNGGWTAGALAGLLEQDSAGARPAAQPDSWPTTTVSLRQPPPLDTPMSVHVDDGVAVASVDDVVVARAQVVVDHEPVPVEPVDPQAARAAEATYLGLRTHPFPACFACGPDREPGDGLRIFPGRVEDADGRPRVAATWTPQPSMADPRSVDGSGGSDGAHDGLARASLPVTWAALDCIGGWGGDLTERPMVLASMTARVDALPVIGEEHVVVGQWRAVEGRKTFTAATLYDRDQRVVALAEHLWIAVDPTTFGG